MAFLIPQNLKSRTEVPAVIQRTAHALQMGLDDDAIVWYEPPYDPSGEKPHLVLLLPNQGIVVLEVLDVRAERLLGIFRGKLRFERDGHHVDAPNPLIRANRLAETLYRRILAEPRLVGSGLSAAAGAVLPGLTEEEARARRIQDVVALERCLFKSDLDLALEGVSEARLLRAFARILPRTATRPMEHKDVMLLRGIIQPDIVIDRVATAASEQLEFTIFRPPTGRGDVIRIMDQRQEALAKSLGDGHRVIRGVAGSGKTLVLVYRAKLLARNFPQHRFLVTCYTRSLAGELRRMLREFANIDVKNLDALMADALKATGTRHPGYEGDPDGERLAGLALKALAQGALPRYRGILIDEAQDFGTNALRFALGLLTPGSNDVFVVADAAQNIYKRPFSWKQAGIQAQGRTRILRVNYRNTREILEFASRFLLAGTSIHLDEAPDIEDEHAVIPPESAERNGPRPELAVLPDPPTEAVRTVEKVRTWLADGAGPRSIAVLYAASLDSGFNRGRALHQQLRAAGVSVHWVNEPDNRGAKGRLGDATAPVVLSTIHSAKGLEFPRVALCGLWQERDDAESNRKLAYVGMTRATDVLAVFTTGKHPFVDDLRVAASNSSFPRQRHVIWILSCAGSMAEDGKIQALNTAIKETIPHMRKVAEQNPNMQVLVRAVTFSTGAKWHIIRPTPVEQVTWHDAVAGGRRDAGRALRLVAEQLGTLANNAQLAYPVLIMITDGRASDDFDDGLTTLMRQPLAKRAVRIGLALGHDADRAALQQFIGRANPRVIELDNPPEALVRQMCLAGPWADFLDGPPRSSSEEIW